MADGNRFLTLHEEGSQKSLSIIYERRGSDQPKPTLFTETLSSIEPTSTGLTTQDDTIPKVVASERKIKDEGEGYGQTVPADEEVSLKVHQCSHQDGLKAEEDEDVHRPKQPEYALLTQAQNGRGAVEESNWLEDCHSFSESDVTGSYKRSYYSRSSSLTNCDKCSAANASLPCPFSREFWEGIEGRRCCERIWHHFFTRLKRMYPNDDALKNRRVMFLLKSLLGVSEQGELGSVHVDKYLRLVKTFGPFRCDGNRCVVLKQLEDIVKNSSISDKRRKISWFAGPMSRKDAEARLEGKAESTFLIRMSETEQESGSFVASLVMKDGTTQHFQLQGHPEEAAQSDPFDLCLEFQGRRYRSLPELVNNYLRVEEICQEGCDNATLCRIICPDLPFHNDFKCYAKTK